MYLLLARRKMQGLITDGLHDGIRQPYEAAELYSLAA